MSTNGIITAVPTHQLGVCCGPKANRTRAIAAGLKTCFRWTAKRYFDAIAKPDAARMNKIVILSKEGVMSNARMNPVMSEESVDVGALKMNENTWLTLQQAPSASSEQTTSATGVNANLPVKLTPKATIRRVAK